MLELVGSSRPTTAFANAKGGWSCNLSSFVDGRGTHSSTFRLSVSA
jgi:hypothetical protein